METRAGQQNDRQDATVLRTSLHNGSLLPADPAEAGFGGEQVTSLLCVPDRWLGDWCAHRLGAVEHEVSLLRTSSHVQLGAVEYELSLLRTSSSHHDHSRRPPPPYQPAPPPEVGRQPLPNQLPNDLHEGSSPAGPPPHMFSTVAPLPPADYPVHSEPPRLHNINQSANQQVTALAFSACRLQ